MLKKLLKPPKHIIMNIIEITTCIALIGSLSSMTACSTSNGQAPTEENAVAKNAAVESPDATMIKNQYILQAGLFDKVTKDISDEEANQRINEQTNSLIWIAGHTLDIQYNLAALLGIQTENPYAEQFAFGQPFDPEVDYPSLSKMQADWNALTPKITQALDQLTQEQLAADSPFPIPFPEQSVRGLLGFQMHHLGYEIGQMGLYRRFLDKAAMSYQ